MAVTAGTTTSFPMSNHTRERVTVAKLTLENFYSNLIIQHEERETRYWLQFLLPLFSFSWLPFGSICSRALGSLCTERSSEVFLYLFVRSRYPEGTGYLSGAVCAGRSVNNPCYSTKQSRCVRRLPLLLLSWNSPPHQIITAFWKLLCVVSSCATCVRFLLLRAGLLAWFLCVCVKG